MLLDMIDQNSRRAPAPMPGNDRSAGIISLLDAAAKLGGKYKGMSDFALEEAKRKNPVSMWDEFRAFKDPRGQWNMETGPTYQGRPMSTYGGTDRLRDNAPTLREYLDGTEMADEFGPQLEQYKVGFAPLPGFDAGVVSPTARSPGMLMMGSHLRGDDIKVGSTFEHEFQHVLQGITGAPRGTAPPFAEEEFKFMASEGLLGPNMIPRMQEAVRRGGRPPGDQLYLHSYGETDARLAEDRYDPTYHNVRPGFADYVNAGGYRIDPTLLWEYRDSDELARKLAKAAARKAGTP